MAASQHKALDTEEIEDLLNNSDGEFIPSDDDLSDQVYQPSDSGSTTSVESEPETQNSTISIRRQGFSRRRSSGRNRRGNGRGRYVRQANNNEELLLSTAAGLLTETWAEDHFPSRPTNVMEPAYLEEDTSNFTPEKYFSRYVNDDLISLIVDKTNQTSIFKTGRSLNLNSIELRTYFGITFVMASINYPSVRMFWTKKWRIGVIADAMARQRFIDIRNNLKLVFDADVSTTQRALDKLWKVRPMIKKIQEVCRTEKKQHSLSIDEMIIPFSGVCGIKQYCPGKPNPVGLKAFVLANPNGMVCDFHIYQGDTTYPEYDNTSFHLGEKAVLTLSKDLACGHTLYFDRYFTTERLVTELKRKGLGCSGTLMKNRIPKEARNLIIEDKNLKLKGRGSSQVLVRNDKEMALTKWYDNKPVLMLSSVEARDTEDECRRWFKTTRRYGYIKRPQVIRNYNSNMGGVDLADRLLAVCPNRFRTKKWTQRFISHMMDLVIGNSWIRYKQDLLKINMPRRQILQLREFKLQIGELLIKPTDSDSSSSSDDDETPPPNSRKRKRGMPLVDVPSKKKRTKKAKHLPILLEQGKCRHCHIKKTFFSCHECKIRLCLTKKRNCFFEFHTEA